MVSSIRNNRDMNFSMLLLLSFFLFSILCLDSSQDVCKLQCIQMTHSKCEICYFQCSKPNQEPKITFQTCKQTKCKSYLDYQCPSHLSDYFTEENCLKICCNNIESLAFSTQMFDQCEHYNYQQMIKKNYYMDLMVNIILGLTLFVSITLVVYGLYLYFSFSKRTMPKNQSSKSPLKKPVQSIKQSIISKNHFHPKLEIQNHSLSQPVKQIKKKNFHKQTVQKIKWKSFSQSANDQISEAPFQSNLKLLHQDQKCSVCKLSQINCQTSCGHYFHILCLNMKIHKKFVCPQCEDSNFNPLRIFCQKCNQKESTFKLELKFESLQMIMNRYKINCDTCRNSIPAAGDF